MSKDPDPFDVPIVFFRIGWMKRYQGIQSDDPIVGGGAFVRENKFGYEILNFQAWEGKSYGYVMPGWANKAAEEFSGVKLERLGATSSQSELKNVLVVWVATHPKGNAYVVGWYKNATVFRDCQDPPSGSERNFEDHEIGYFASCASDDATLLKTDDRVFRIAQSGPGAFGQSNIWYADNRDIVSQRNLRKDLLRIVDGRQVPKQSGGTPRNTDVLARQKVEQAAVQLTARTYEEKGYEVRSVEKDNVGWDLEARLDKRLLRLEVKGLSGSKVQVELTPNEYRKMQEFRDSYRLCVVTNALKTPVLAVFEFSNDSGRWEDEADNVLSVEEIVSARCGA